MPSRRKADAPGQYFLAPDFLAKLPPPPDSWDDDYERLMYELAVQYRLRGYRPPQIMALTRLEIRTACRIARAYDWLLPRDSSAQEEGASNSALGLKLLRFSGKKVRLCTGEVVQMSRGEHGRGSRYLFTVNAELGSEADRVRALLAKIVEARSQSAAARVGGAPKKFELKFKDMVSAAQLAGCFTWLDMSSHAGQSAFGLALLRFCGFTTVLPDGRRLAFSNNGRRSRAKRYRIQVIDAG